MSQNVLIGGAIAMALFASGTAISFYGQNTAKEGAFALQQGLLSAESAFTAPSQPTASSGGDSPSSSSSSQSTNAGCSMATDGIMICETNGGSFQFIKSGTASSTGYGNTFTYNGGKYSSVTSGIGGSATGGSAAASSSSASYGDTFTYDGVTYTSSLPLNENVANIKSETFPYIGNVAISSSGNEEYQFMMASEFYGQYNNSVNNAQKSLLRDASEYHAPVGLVQNLIKAYLSPTENDGGPAWGWLKNSDQFFSKYNNSFWNTDDSEMQMEQDVAGAVQSILSTNAWYYGLSPSQVDSGLGMTAGSANPYLVDLLEEYGLTPQVAPQKTESGTPTAISSTQNDITATQPFSSSSAG